MILLAHLLVGDEQPAFLRFLMPEMTFLTHIHSIYELEIVLDQFWQWWYTGLKLMGDYILKNG